MAATRKPRPRKKTTRNLLLLILLAAAVAAFYLLNLRKNVPDSWRGSGIETTGNAALPQELAEPERHLLPAVCAECQLVQHHYYCLSYDEPYEEPEWVAYRMTKDRLQARVQRADHFEPDPAVSTGSADNADYRRSGFDRGHLVPAADMRWDAEAMRETFFFSNICPQLHTFNDGIWKDLENKVRDWAREHGSVYILAGPVLEPGLPTIGHDKVAVPRMFFKLVVDVQEPGIEAVAFLMPNQPAGRKTVDQFAMSVDELERRLGRDFLTQLPDSLENPLEADFSPNHWFE